jgi:hypothetical protein
MTTAIDSECNGWGSWVAGPNSLPKGTGVLWPTQDFIYRTVQEPFLGFEGVKIMGMKMEIG